MPTTWTPDSAALESRSAVHIGPSPPLQPELTPSDIASDNRDRWDPYCLSANSAAQT
jgi:hypothetical protein